MEPPPPLITKFYAYEQNNMNVFKQIVVEELKLRLRSCSTPAPFDLNFAGSAPSPFRTKICYKSFIFVYWKSISITTKPKKISFLDYKIISKIIIFLQNFKKLLELGAALIYDSSDSSYGSIPIFLKCSGSHSGSRRKNVSSSGSDQIMRLRALRLRLPRPGKLLNKFIWAQL